MTCTVVIPVHTNKLSKNHILGAQRALDLFKDFSPVILCHSRIVDWVKATFGFSVSLKIVDFAYLKSVRDYNRLMLSVDFYDQFSASDYILICQPDVFVYHNSLTKFYNKGDYGGALTLFNEHQPVVGNGGFSIRKVKAMQHILSRRLVVPKMWRLSLPIWKRFVLGCAIRVGFEDYFVRSGRVNEDYVLSMMMESNDVMNEIDASWFSQDAIAPKHNVTPMAFHAWEKYASVEERNYILRQLNG